MRMINYAAAIREAHAQLLAADERVFVIGQGLWSPWYAGSSLKDLDKQFGRERIFDSPVSENALSSTAERNPTSVPEIFPVSLTAASGLTIWRV